ncbi:hypothetical protein D3C71_1329810 [compost metagenome]
MDVNVDEYYKNTRLHAEKLKAALIEKGIYDFYMQELKEAKLKNHYHFNHTMIVLKKIYEAVEFEVPDFMQKQYDLAVSKGYIEK